MKTIFLIVIQDHVHRQAWVVHHIVSVLLLLASNQSDRACLCQHTFVWTRIDLLRDSDVVNNKGKQDRD